MRKQKNENKGDTEVVKSEINVSTEEDLVCKADVGQKETSESSDRLCTSAGSSHDKEGLTKDLKSTEKKDVDANKVETTIKSDKIEKEVSQDESYKKEKNIPKDETNQQKSADSDNEEDPIASWGKPLGLPSPIRPGTPSKYSKRSEEDSAETKNKDSTVDPVWMDLAYVPHHGCKDYVNADFFKKIRARYYVFSGVEPSKDVFNALIEAKKTWENKEQEVTIIPTYDTDVLGYWVAENEELLSQLKIDLAPSASRCTINLQDHETSCAAYRLEF